MATADSTASPIPKSRVSTALVVTAPEDGKAIQVICRVKPLLVVPGVEAKSLFTEITKTTVTMSTSYAHDLMQYKFNRVFQAGDSDADIFESVLPVIHDVLGGINGAVLAYGQTNAGKTRTMVGIPGDDRYERQCRCFRCTPQTVLACVTFHGPPFVFPAVLA